MTRGDYLYFGLLILGLLVWACARAVHQAPPQQEPEEAPPSLQERPQIPTFPPPAYKPPRKKFARDSQEDASCG